MIKDAAKSRGERVRERRLALGLGQEKLAELAGTSQATIDKIEHGRSQRSRFLPAVYSALGLPLNELTGPMSARAVNLTVYSDRGSIGAGRDLPVFASVEGGDGAITIGNEPIDWVGRPQPLEHVRDGYGVIVTGTSMEPAFRPGDTALVHPNLPPRIEDVVILLAADRSVASIKEYRGQTDKHWRVRRYSPSMEDFTLLKADWPVCHKVIGKYSRQ